MTMTDDDQPAPLVHEITDRSGPQTPMEALRAKRNEAASKRDVLIPVGSAYDEEGLRVKYRLLERPDTDEIAKRVRKQTKDRSEFMFRVLVDTIIAACDGFFLIPDGKTEAEAEPLMSEDGSHVIETYIQFASDLAGEEFTNHRAAVLYVFGDNEFTAGQHGLLLNKWLGDTSIDIDSELLEG